MDDFLVKSISHEIKSIGDEGIIEAYANVYDFEDSDGDVSGVGSFKRTVNNNGKRIRVLKDHRDDVLLGIPKKMDADDGYGLFTVSQFNLEKQVSKDMFSDIKLLTKEGLSAELSIGYWVMARDRKNPKIITEYKLKEYSFLSSWAANELSRVTGIKSIKSVYGVMELLTKMYNLNYSDPKLRQIETILQSLSKDPSDLQDTLKSDPIDGTKIITELSTVFAKWT